MTKKYNANKTQEDLAAFHASHFSTLPTEHFTQHFLGPVDEEYTEEAEDDELGYYDDGVKRTLTDQQIAIFRHSEIETLLRDRRHTQEARGTPTPGLEDGELEDSELDVEAGELPGSDDSRFPVAEVSKPIETRTPTAHNPPKKNNKKTSKKAKKAEIAREKGFFKQNIKPDLRKRTWDKVESGLGNLDYDDESSPAQIQGPPTQRRRISYDD